MKRTLIILSAVLVGTFIVLSLVGGSKYAAEKALYKINKKYAKIKEDTLATPEGRYQEVVNDYKKFLAKYPQSNLAPIAHISIGRTYVLKGDYESARAAFERVVQQYAKDQPSIAGQAVLEIGGTYAQEKKYDGLIKTYDRLIRDFPLTRQGMEAPLARARAMVATNQAAASEAFDNAIKYYRQLVIKHGKSPISFMALNFIAGAQMMQKRWQQVVDAYAEILMDYPDPQYMDARSVTFLLKAINTISVAQLGNIDLPAKIYGKFMEKYPDHKLNPLLKQMIKGLEELKVKVQEQAQQETTAPQPAAK